MGARSELLLEIDGPGVSPKTVDPLQLLQLAEAWFRLTLKVAEGARVGLSLLGIDVRAKCAAIAVRTSNQSSARIASARALSIVAGDEPAPAGAGEATEDVRRGLRALAPDHSASVRVGAKWLRKIALPATVEADRPWESTALRVTPVRVGARDQAGTAQLASDSEDGVFTVSVSIDDARLLGAALGKQLDVDLELCRDPSGRIERGRVLAVFPLDESADPVAAWRAWAAVNAAEWNDVDNVSEALGRGVD